MLTEVGVASLFPASLPFSPALLPSLLEFLVEERDLLVSTGVLRTGGPANENSVTAVSAS